MTYSTCSENLQHLLVLCPHCNKQFSNDESLSYHLMGNEFYSNKQDKVFDMLNRLPNMSNATKSGSKRLKFAIEDDEDKSSPAVFHIKQGVIVNSNNTYDNQ